MLLVTLPLALLLLAAPLAHGHVTANPNTMESGASFVYLDFRVPHALGANSVTHEVILEIPESVQALGDAKPFEVSDFDVVIDKKNITPVSDGHGGFRTTTVTRIHWIAEGKTGTGVDPGLEHEYAQHFSVTLSLPCWCALSSEVNYNPPVGRNFAALYFKLTQNVTMPDGSSQLLVWGDRPVSSVPSNWGKVSRPMPVVYLADSDFCAQCIEIQPPIDETVSTTANPAASSDGEHSHNDDVRVAVIALAVILGVAMLAIVGLIFLLLSAIRKAQPTSASSYKMNMVAMDSTMS